LRIVGQRYFQGIIRIKKETINMLNAISRNSADILSKKPPVLSIVGNSGSGKTTFIVKLIPELIKNGLKVGSIKHDVHGFEMDKPGKDSWRHKKAGAATTIITSPQQIGMVMDVDHDHNPDELAPLFIGVDIILAEGFKWGKRPKIEIFRPEVTEKPLLKGDPHLLALISDAAIDVEVPIFSPNNPADVAGFIMAHFKLSKPASAMNTPLGAAS